MAEAAYTAKDITVLEGLEPVRKRPGMYIGTTGSRGLHHLVFEVVDNSVDEAMAGRADLVEVTLHPDNSVTVSDNGSGIPTDVMKDQGLPAVTVVLTKLHAGGKFGGEGYKVSGGLHGVGVSVVNALSEWLELEIWRNGLVHQQRYERGDPTADLNVTGKTEKRGTKITFKADPDIFESTDFSFETLSQRLRELAFLNAGVTITIDDERDGKHHAFVYEGGIREFVEFLNKNKTPVNEKPVVMIGERDDIVVEIALQWNDAYTETTYTFANNINTTEGGTHLSGFRAALTRTINHYSSKNSLAEADRERERRRHPRRHDGGNLGEDPAAAVRGPDQDQARQYRGQGHRRGHRQRQVGCVSRRKPWRGQEGHRQGRGGRAGPRGGAQGA